MYLLKEDQDVNAKIANLTRKVEAMELSRSNIGRVPVIDESIYEICESNEHLTKECPQSLPLRRYYMNKQISQITINDPFSTPTTPTGKVIPILAGSMDP